MAGILSCFSRRMKARPSLLTSIQIWMRLSHLLAHFTSPLARWQPSSLRRTPMKAYRSMQAHHLPTLSISRLKFHLSALRTRPGRPFLWQNLVLQHRTGRQVSACGHLLCHLIWSFHHRPTVHQRHSVHPQARILIALRIPTGNRGNKVFLECPPHIIIRLPVPILLRGGIDQVNRPRIYNGLTFEMRLKGDLRAGERRYGQIAQFSGGRAEAGDVVTATRESFRRHLRQPNQCLDCIRHCHERNSRIFPHE
jgi:hypothetical protein